MPTTGSLSISDLLTPETIRVGAPETDKASVLDALIDLLDGHPSVTDLAAVRHDVFEREAQMSTGVGLGLALPHARTTAVTETVAALATTREPVPFEAHDGEPVRLLFLLVGPEQARGRHIRLLGRVSRLMNQDSFRQRLLAAPSSEDALALFRDADAKLAV
jgi:PTS system fructose-specific IIA component